MEGVLGSNCVRSSCCFGADFGSCLWILNFPFVGAPELQFFYLQPPAHSSRHVMKLLTFSFSCGTEETQDESSDIFGVGWAQMEQYVVC